MSCWAICDSQGQAWVCGPSKAIAFALWLERLQAQGHAMAGDKAIAEQMYVALCHPASPMRLMPCTARLCAYIARHGVYGPCRYVDGGLDLQGDDVGLET